jgi:hypothetical protein
MPLELWLSTHQQSDVDLAQRAIFLSASIPDVSRWSGNFDPLAITDAVVATARAVLSSNGRLVNAAHPTMAPLILYVARELPTAADRPPATLIYQSKLFSDVLPPETYELAQGGLAELRWTEAALGDEPEPGKWDESLSIMRRTMLQDNDVAAAIFIGGMEGIRAEFELFRQLYPARPTYALGRPGGEAAGLTQLSRPNLTTELTTSASYSALLRHIVLDIASI